MGQTSFSQNVTISRRVDTEQKESREQIRFATMRTCRFVSYEKDNARTRPEDIVPAIENISESRNYLRLTFPYQLILQFPFVATPFSTSVLLPLRLTVGVSSVANPFVANFQENTLRSNGANYFFKFVGALSGRLRWKAFAQCTRVCVWSL